MVEIKILKNDSNKRLDNFIKKYLKNAPLSFIYRLFRKKDIKVNGVPAKQDYITKENDLVFVYINKDQEKEFIEGIKIKTSTKQDFTIVYEDDNLLIVNKPNNLLVHEGDVNSKDDETLTGQVLHYLIESGFYHPEQENTFVPSLAHRIDRNTSGIVVFGKNLLALQSLFEAFKDHGGIDKKYVALVAGEVNASGSIDAPLIKNEKTKIVDIDFKNGLTATTLYKPLKVMKDCSLLEVKILTGRTHQIRVHLKYINHALVGDNKYGNSFSDSLAKKYKMKNYLLHANKICFHNLKGVLSYLNEKELIAPLWKWQQDLVEKIKRGE